MPARQLAVGDQQKVEILKQLLAGARVLILDEPTKVLAPQESEGLFKTHSELRSEGLGIVLITHKLREVLACADRIRGHAAGPDGGRRRPKRGRAKTTCSRSCSATSRSSRRLPPSDAEAPRPGPSRRSSRSMFRPPAATAQTPLRDISMKMRCRRDRRHRRSFRQRPAGTRRPRSRPAAAATRSEADCGAKTRRDGRSRAVRDKGVAAIPDDPLAHACVPGLTVRENLALGSGGATAPVWASIGSGSTPTCNRSFARLGFPRPNFDARAANSVRRQSAAGRLGARIGASTRN